jgi:hypothetical protein
MPQPTEYGAWLDLARRTAWGVYLRTSPQAERLLLETMQIIMSEFGGGGEKERPRRLRLRGGAPVAIGTGR